MQQLNIYNSTAKLDDNQAMYDSFNTFMFSNDRNVFNKLYYKFKLYEMTHHLLGDIVECGVFKGTGLMAWLKILQLNEANSIRKVIGFDFFNQKALIDQWFVRRGNGEVQGDDPPSK